MVDQIAPLLPLTQIVKTSALEKNLSNQKHPKKKKTHEEAEIEDEVVIQNKNVDSGNENLHHPPEHTIDIEV